MNYIIDTKSEEFYILLLNGKAVAYFLKEAYSIHDLIDRYQVETVII